MFIFIADLLNFNTFILFIAGHICKKDRLNFMFLENECTYLLNFSIYMITEIGYFCIHEKVRIVLTDLWQRTFTV